MSRWQLPNGWVWKKISEISDVNPRRPTILRNDDEPTSFVPMEDVDEVEGKFKQIQVKPYREVKRGYTYFEEGDVLFAKITPSMENGKTAIARNLIDGIGFGTTEFHVFRPHEHISPDWIHYFIRQTAFRNEAKHHFRGAVGQQRVPVDFLETYEIPVPYADDSSLSLDTQRRIVARIEALLSEVRDMRALQADIAQNTQTLFISVLQDEFSELCRKHGTISVEEMVQQDQLEIRGGGTPSKQRAEYWEGDIPWVSPKDMKTWIIEDSEDHITEAAIDGSSAKRIPEGSVLVVVRGMILARHWPVAITGRDVTINQDMKALIPKNGLLSKYLGYSLLAATPTILRKVETAAHGTKRLPSALLDSIEVPRVPTSHQQRVVARLETVQSEISEMRMLQEADHHRIKGLEDAILAQAFRGEL